MYSFVNQNDLEIRDYVCSGLSLALIVVYHAYLIWYSYSYPHSSLESHMDYQRIWWVRQVYDDVREKISTIQNFRSTMMIMGFYTKMTLVGAATSVEVAVMTPGFEAKARGFVPALLFIASFANLIFCAFALFYLHWHCTLEMGPPGLLAAAGAGAMAADAQARGDTEGITEHEMKRSKLHIAALVVQLKLHFRMTQRFMLVAVAALMWSVEPVAMLVCYILLHLNFYYCDFPFPEEVNEVFTKSTGLARGNRAIHFERTHDRVQGVIRPKTITVKSNGQGMYKGGMSPMGGSVRGSFSMAPGMREQNMLPYRASGYGLGNSINSGQPQFLSPQRLDGPRRSDGSVRLGDSGNAGGPRPTLHTPLEPETGSGSGTPTTGPRTGLQRGNSTEVTDTVRTNPHRLDGEIPPLLISNDEGQSIPHQGAQHRNSLSRDEVAAEMHQIPQINLLTGETRGGRQTLAGASPGTASWTHSSPTPDADGNSHSQISQPFDSTHNSRSPTTPTVQKVPIEGAVVVTSDTEDDDEEDFMAMQ